jgi:hypothetical protein
MIGDDDEHRVMSSKARAASTLYVPLAYWFNRHNGLALPLIALQYHDVRVSIKYRVASDCVNYKGTTANVMVDMADSYLLIDYVFLDSEERKRFAQASHEYLIEQLQFTGAESLTNNTNNKYRLNFNHPSKYLVWAAHLEAHDNASQWVAYADDGDWEAARDRFAKLVWLASRTGLTSTGFAAGTTGEVVQPAIASSGLNQRVKDLAAKVSAQLVFVDEGGNAPASLGNVVVLSNMLTVEDMTNPVVDLDCGSVGNALLLANSVTVVDHFNYGRWVDCTSNPVSTAKLQLNGHDRFQQRDGNYFNYVQPFQHFSNTPADGVNVYSFALKPEDHQPTGTCNFSRIDNATLLVDVGLYNKAYSSVNS